eukprot:GFUD01039134.1.p1 GENE.GFUD01039134.1~~GFUD01039134.1.p1  ORF type:complete len:412 (+),score=136.84 GFUD01039134.1:62-1297(+)
MSAFLPESDSEDELPPGWEERSTLSGSVYYANHDMASTQWTHPRTGKKKNVSDSLPFGWDRKILDDNKVVYVDLLNKKTSYTDPRLAFAKETTTPGTPFRQKHDASTTALQILHGRDLTGSVAVVTGGNSGIGWQTARALAYHGCCVVLACRNKERAEVAMDTIRAERPQAKCEWLHLDLERLETVKSFVMRFSLLHTKLDYLVLNAGVYTQTHSMTGDGWETMMQVNYLAQFYLTNLLLKHLLSSPSPRVVTLTSESHRFSLTTLTNLPSPLQFSPMASQFTPVLQHNDSKLFCLLFSQALHHKFHHLGLCSLAVHPGNLVSTNLYRHSLLYRLIATLCRPFTKSPAQAAGSVIFSLCGEEPQLSSSSHTYINNCFPSLPSEVGRSEKLAELVWDLTVREMEGKLGEKWQ